MKEWIKTGRGRPLPRLNPDSKRSRSVLVSLRALPADITSMAYRYKGRWYTFADVPLESGAVTAWKDFPQPFKED